MTADYTFVSPERQNELTRRMQKRLTQAVEPSETADQEPIPGTNEAYLNDLTPITPDIQ
jgi:hypothetical protein